MLSKIKRCGKYSTSESSNLVHSITEEIKASFQCAVKRAIVKREFFQNNELKERFKFLKLPSFELPPSVAMFGKVSSPIPIVSFDTLQREIGSLHFSRSEGMYKVVSTLEDIWRDDFEQLKCFTVELEKNQSTPLCLDEFVSIQRQQCTGVMKDLVEVWRKGLINSLLDNLGNEYNFYESSLEVLEQSGLFGLFKRFNLQMSNQLSQFTIRAIKEWVSFVSNTCEMRTTGKRLYYMS